ncbi:MAG: glycosyltransferase family 4 protein [Acidobacteriaceae bacterium]|nr:glycosyltransferase family 4 protein [Acidobacteriaceae bacterium]
MIDFTQIPVLRTGVGVYAENLACELDHLVGSGDSLFVLIQSDEQSLPKQLGAAKNVQFVRISSRLFRNRAALLFFEQLVLPFILLGYRIEVLHSLHYTHPLICPCRRVVTIHDLTFLLFPGLHTWGRRLIIPFFIRHAMRNADAVIFVSESTRSDAERIITRSRALGAVVPLGVDPNYSLSPESEELCSRLTKLGVNQPFILNIGTIEPRKNLLRLIEAFENVADHRPELSLVLAGKLGWFYSQILAQINGSRHAERILAIGFVTEYDKRALLNACELFIYPSLYEGFGLPVLEAMSAGAPVITSSNSSLAEVAGDAAELVDPESVSELSNAISHLLEDEGKMAALRGRGKSRSASFTWANTARKTYDVYVKTVSKPIEDSPSFAKEWREE